MVEVEIVHVQSGRFSDPHPGAGEQRKERAVLAGCRFEDLSQLLLGEVRLPRPVRWSETAE